MEFRLGNSGKAYILCTEDKHPKYDDRFANFLDVNDAEFDLDADGNKIVRPAVEDNSVAVDGNKTVRPVVEYDGWPTAEGF